MASGAGRAIAAHSAAATMSGIAIATVLLARGSLSAKAPAALAFVVTAYLAALPFFYLHWHAFGDPFATTYRSLEGAPVTAGAFDLGDVIPHALQAFVSPFYFDQAGFRSLTAEPMLATMFFLVLTPLGFAAFVRRASSARKVLAVGFAAAATAATVFYLAYYFTGSYGLHYGAVHYFKPWWPLWAIAAVVGVERGVRWLQPQRVVVG